MASPDAVGALVREHARLEEEDRVLGRAMDILAEHRGETSKGSYYDAVGELSEARMAVRRRALETLMRLDIAEEVRRWP